MLVPSANVITSDILFINIRKSLTYRLKCGGPMTDPWGTPCPALPFGSYHLDKL